MTAAVWFRVFRRAKFWAAAADRRVARAIDALARFGGGGDSGSNSGCTLRFVFTAPSPPLSACSHAHFGVRSRQVRVYARATARNR